MALNNEFYELVDDLCRFMQKKFGYDSQPHITFAKSKKNGNNILGFTGHYDHNNQELVIYVTNRHPKDILRSLAHELLHHVQWHEGGFEGHDTSAAEDPNYIMDDEFLKGIEADAFERGNIAFREWEAYKKGYKKMDKKKEEVKEEVVVNPALKEAHAYVPSERPAVYSDREELIYQDLLKKFGIKK
jgi:hypothetical protein